MIEIIKVYKESFPALRLIGKRYTNNDRGPDGSLSNKWGEWFEKGYFKELEGLGSLPECEGAYLGCMRQQAEFEYWIGMFFPEATPVPEGYMYVDIPSSRVGTCWIYGHENSGEFYGHEAYSLSTSKIEEAGWQIAEASWVLERYNCPRFTTPDEKGNVILDYCFYLKED